MPQHYPWWPERKGDQIIMLTNCMSAWPSIGPTLGFTNGQVVDLSLLLAEFLSVVNEVDQTRIATGAVVEWRDTVLYGPETNKPAPAAPVVPTPATPTINGGFFAQLKRWRAQVMASPNYTLAIGEALGFVGPEMPGRNPSTAMPSFTVTSAQDYWVNFKGSLQGYDSVNVQYQRKGTGSWENVGYLTKTPGGLQITPTSIETAEMGFVRCRFVLKNQAVGSYSPNYPVTIS